MITKLSVVFLALFLTAGCRSLSPSVSAPASRLQDPAELYGELFDRVQTAPVFSDSKYFVDMLPAAEPTVIMERYHLKNPQTIRELKAFVEQNFLPPADFHQTIKDGAQTTINDHIKMLWGYLERKPDEENRTGSSLIPLPYSYVVPGGRFREIYYWDSYFTQLGLLADHEDKIFQNMVRNFAHLENSLGRIPNGNRKYYLGRSQAPFFSYMVSLWESRFGSTSAIEFIPALKQEYDFWMSGAHDLKAGEAKARVVHFNGNDFLNRYWDDKPGPRPEAYKEDLALAQKAFTLYHRPVSETYQDLRAGAESGWDFSSRWFKDPTQFATIQTTSYVPIDLNALLYHLELKLSELYGLAGDTPSSIRFRALAKTRRELIQKYLWDEKSGTYRDYNWRTHKLSSQTTMAMAVALFSEVATDDQATKVAKALTADFLKPGGVVTTKVRSGQQWDSPNGWAPLQWMAYAGLRRYKKNELAEKIRDRWLKINLKIFASNGKLTEKYNVIDLSLKSGGGEYPAQDGFGWTNGVYRALSTPEDSLKHILEVP